MDPFLSALEDLEGPYQLGQVELVEELSHPHGLVLITVVQKPSLVVV